MKKWILSFVVVSIVSVLIVGCTTVGAVNLPVDIDGNEKQAEEISSQSPEDIEPSKDEADKQKQDKVDIETGIDEDPLGGKDEEEKDELESDEKPVIIESKIHYSGDGSKKLVSLTFDDGPETKFTQEILNILEEYNIKATFFVIGQNVEKYPEVLKEIREKGHEIGNHSWSHKYLPKVSKKTLENEILMTEKAIRDILGDYDPIFRPPYGAIKKQGIEQINSLGYHVVNWSVDTRDWAGTSKDQMMSYVKQQLTPGGIILMHNSGSLSSFQNITELLPEMIEWISEQGYEFTTVSEILDL